MQFTSNDATSKHDDHTHDDYYSPHSYAYHVAYYDDDYSPPRLDLDSYRGGAVFFYRDNVDVTFTNTDFTGNTARDGGAVDVGMT